MWSYTEKNRLFCCKISPVSLNVTWKSLNMFQRYLPNFSAKRAFVREHLRVKPAVKDGDLAYFLFLSFSFLPSSPFPCHRERLLPFLSLEERLEKMLQSKLSCCHQSKTPDGWAIQWSSLQPRMAMDHPSCAGSELRCTENRHQVLKT